MFPLDLYFFFFFLRKVEFGSVFTLFSLPSAGAGVWEAKWCFRREPLSVCSERGTPGGAATGGQRKGRGTKNLPGMTSGVIREKDFQDRSRFNYFISELPWKISFLVKLLGYQFFFTPSPVEEFPSPEQRMSPEPSHRKVGILTCNTSGRVPRNTSSASWPPRAATRKREPQSLARPLHMVGQVPRKERSEE